MSDQVATTSTSSSRALRVETDPVTGAPIVRFTDGYSATSAATPARWACATASRVPDARRRRAHRVDARQVDRQLIDPAPTRQRHRGQPPQRPRPVRRLRPRATRNELRRPPELRQHRLRRPGAARLSPAGPAACAGPGSPTGKLDSNLRLLYDTGGPRTRRRFGRRRLSATARPPALEWRLRYDAHRQGQRRRSAASWYRARRTTSLRRLHRPRHRCCTLSLTWAVLRNATLGCAGRAWTGATSSDQRRPSGAAATTPRSSAATAS